MTSETDFALQLRVELDDQPLPERLEPLLEQVVVDEHLHLPGMFVLSFRDLERTVLQEAGARIGARVVIRGSAVGEAATRPLISGEITSLEADYDSLGARAVVRGYDPSHRFHRGRRTHTYRNVTDSDLVRAVAQRAGVDIATIDESSTTYVHVSQANVSDWVFLKARAQETGFELRFDDGKLSFTRPRSASEGPTEGDFSSQDPLQLVMGQELLEFRPRITSSEQVREVEVRGWDPMLKQALSATAPAKASSARLKTEPAALAKIFDAPTFVRVDRPLSDQAAVDATAAALAEQVGSSFAEASGVARGNPRLHPGVPFSVSIVGDDFAGQYTASSVRHVFDKDGYRTEFAVSGRQERSLLGLTSGGGAAARQRGGAPAVNGAVVGTVTNNDDPERLGRVKLSFPWLSDDYESDWARVVQLGAGPDSGAVFLPEVRDEVLVSFEFGDMRRPYVIGGLYNGVDKPRLGDDLFDSGQVKRRGFVSRRGHRVVLLDHRDKSGIALLTSDDRLRIALKETGSEIHVYGDGRIVIEATNGLEIRSERDLTIEAAGQLKLQGQAGVKIESSGVVDVDGSLIQLN